MLYHHWTGELPACVLKRGSTSSMMIAFLDISFVGAISDSKTAIKALLADDSVGFQFLRRLHWISVAETVLELDYKRSNNNFVWSANTGTTATIM